MYPDVLHSQNKHLTIAQISDLHLIGKVGTHDSYQRFLGVLQLVITQNPDLLVLTGDLVNDGNSTAYDWLFATLQRTKIPFVCLVGNHDVTHEIGIDLPFNERIHLPITPDKRLPMTHRIFLARQNWQLLLVNTATMGRDDGRIAQTDLAWLEQMLATHTVPTIIALHHQPLAIGSRWIDDLMLQNADEFWQIISRHTHAQAVICGHVHQAHQLDAPTDHQCTLFTCPAVARQFLPFADNFALDELPAGFRLLQIEQNQLKSNIKRL